MPDFKAIQDKWQKKWKNSKLFEAEIDKKKEKFFITVPYPYISGSLHIGHSRVVTEADVYSRYLRMAGKNVLYPIAFHISGTPVLGISLAIKNNDKDKIELYKSYVRNYVKTEKEAESVVKTFEDPWKIVEFFIPKMVDEFSTLGLGVDWRRSFTSGDAMHRKMVEWQFGKYREKNYLIQGKYPVLYSKSLGNAVGEDDIIEGDTSPVDKQEFTLIKFKYNDSFIIAATLRPETMYGQTNMWANPDVEYVTAKVNNEKWIISSECADKLKYQDKKVEITGKIHGKELLGKACTAPFIEREIIILPSTHCEAGIGTGFVTSVPSDAPFDWISLKELQESDAMCKKYNLDYNKIKSIQLIPIIESKDYGKFPAVEICKKMNITSLSQHEKLQEATQEIYKLGFHTGVMMSTCGRFAGMKVIEAKDAMKAELLKQKKADILYETSRQAKSRDGGEVIVAVLDNQWFIDFNAKGWKKEACECLNSMAIVPEKFRKQFQDTFEWLDKRPCARKRGLGTKLPYDREWVIESLSDSTLYMTLYTIADKVKEYKLKEEQLLPEFFDYVYLGKGDLKKVSAMLKITEPKLKALREAFDYWYPNDHRHTFTAHLSNHLSFMIFAHTACLPKDKWPKKITFHGMVMSEGAKMSKSKGNVVTLLDINNKYGADTFRAFLCNSTSIDSTLNWESDEVEKMKTHLASLFDLCNDICANRKKGKLNDKFDAFVSKFENDVKKAGEFLAAMNLRDYSSIVLHDVPRIYRKARHISEKDIPALNDYIAERYVKILCPLVPHYAEELWAMIGKGFVSNSKWPSFDEKKIDLKAEAMEQIAENVASDIRKVLELAKIEKPNKVTLFTADKWKYELVEHVKKLNTRNAGEIIKSVMQTPLKQHGQDIMKLVPKLAEKVPEFAFEKKEEEKALKDSVAALEKEFNCKIEILDAEKSQIPKAKQAMPAKPAILAE